MAYRVANSPASTFRKTVLSCHLLLWCGLVCTLASDKASVQYQFDVMTTENGLPQNSIYAILETRDGYLWFTTTDGLVRYDGVQFTIFDKANTKGINSNRFRSLFVDEM